MSALSIDRIGAATALAVLGWTLTAGAQDLGFSAPQFLPGDLAPGPAAGHQERARIARGGDQSLAVWVDSRTSPDSGWPQSTEGNGADIYAARIDADGNVIDTSPIIINQDFGDQRDVNVAWNGEHWLVAWQAPIDTISNTQLLAVRVAPDGSVLDDPPLQLYTATYELLNIEIAGGDGSWMIVTQSTGGEEATVRAIAIAADGSMPVPGGISIYQQIGLFTFDVAYATGEYLIIWGNLSGARFGRLFGPQLEIGPWFWLPFVDTVASDGTDFLVLRAESSGPLASVEAIRVMHDGSMPDPAFTIFVQQDAQAGTCCAQVAWDGTYYWTSWGGSMLARVTPDGTLLDPGGFPMDQPATSPTSELFIDSAPGGGLQAVWNDGVGGAAYPKDVHTGRISTTGDFVNEALLSAGAPAQLETDFAVGDGMHLVAFISRHSGTGRIMVQRIDPAGNAIDAEPIEVATGPIPGLGLPWIQSPAAAWNGSLFMITWSDGFQVFGRRMLPDGTFVDATPLVIMDGHEPDVAAVGSVFLVVALDFINGNAQWQSVYSMRVDGATGVNLDAESVLIGGDFVIFARHPHVVSWGDRWLAVSQFNLSHDNTIAGTGGAIIDADGTSPGWIGIPIGWRPDVAVSGDRALFVAVSQTIASAHADIEAQVMLADGSLFGNWFTISNAPDKQLMPTAVWNGTEFLVAWEDKRNSVYYFDERTDIYGARVSADGVVLDPAGVPLASTPMPEVDVELLSSGGTTLLAASTFRPDAGIGAYRIGIQSDDLPLLEGDANRDGRVDVFDLVEVIMNWGPCSAPPAPCDADMDGSGTVDVADLVMVITNWS